MQIHLTADQEVQLARVANHEGKPIEQILTESAVSMLRENDRFLKAVEEGLAAAERGDFIEEEEMDVRIGEMLKP